MIVVGRKIYMFFGGRAAGDGSASCLDATGLPAPVAPGNLTCELLIWRYSSFEVSEIKRRLIKSIWQVIHAGFSI